MSWHTKEDVLDDLAEVMGNGINEFDEQFILRGGQPPPPACSSNEVGDDELYLRLHGGLGDKSLNEDCEGPDLSGITEMLRMVDQFHGWDTENDIIPTQDSSSTGITITKLNVNVPEFVPKNGIDNENINIDKLCSDQIRDPAKIKEISDKLKSKISSSSTTNNLKVKRDRNLAIASLLKLHSKENSASDDTTPKLITPEHFQKNNSEQLNQKSSQSSSKQLLPIKPLPQVKNIECDIENKEEANNTNPALEESVAKVNSWLNKGSDKQQLETKGPALYLGPVTFKKKEIKKPKTPNSDVSDKSIKRMADNSFVPSEYANKLTQNYMDRVKAKEEKSLDMWGKLEMALKAKDEEIFAKRMLSDEERNNGSQS